MNIRSAILVILSFVLVTACKKKDPLPECYDDVCEESETYISCPRDCWLEDIFPLLVNGGRADWSKDGTDIIAFDAAFDPDGYYDIAIMNPDATGIKCLTCNNPLLPKHNGNPVWHPNGNWIVFQGEKRFHVGTSEFSVPSIGTQCDLYAISTDGTKLFPLTYLADSPNNGVLNPTFSPDGTKLAWSRMLVEATSVPKEFYGKWRLQVADFAVVNDTPRISNVIDIIPGDDVYYANHGFSNDAEHLIFSSNMYTLQAPAIANQIYKMKISDQSWTALTDMEYNETASYIPSRDKIMWATSVGNMAGTDLWMMDADGNNKERLSFFNYGNYIETSADPLKVGDISWSPDGRYMLCFAERDPVLGTGDIYVFSFAN